MRRLLQITTFFISMLFFISCSSESLAPELENAEIKSVENSNGKAAQSKMDPELLATLSQVRKATSRYHDVNKAKANGYKQFSLHIPGMGIHYLHDSIINGDGSSNLDNNLDHRDPEILVYVDDAEQSQQRRLVAAEYAVPMESSSPPANALELFPGLEEHDWHVHPSSHELPMLTHDWTIHGECHYQGGLGVFLAENPDGDFVLFTPPTGAFGSWSGTVAPNQCPSSLGGNPLPPLLIAHGKWWTLHAWVWYKNPEGVFHPTNPRVGLGN